VKLTVDVLPPKNFSQPGAPLAAIVAGDCLLGVLAGDLSLTVDGGGLAAVLGGGVGVATPIGGDEMDAGEEVRLYLPSLP